MTSLRAEQPTNRVSFPTEASVQTSTGFNSASYSVHKGGVLPRR